MRKLALFGLLVVLLAGGGLLYVARPGWLDALSIGGDTALLRTLSRQFIEDIQFKDFVKAARYHAPELQGKVDIPYLLERLFMIKPEQLDINDYEVLFSDIDSSGLRGRVKLRIKINNLLQQRPEDRELMLYFHRASTAAPWYMVLESSLRDLQGEKDKLH